MKIIQSQYSISEIRDMLKRGDLYVNSEYQRSPNIWPPQAKSYFIDTILEGFPIPKIYIHENYDIKRKKPKREIVDGQQRITTLVEFLEGNLTLSSASKNFAKKSFNHLDEDGQHEFLTTSLQVDNILQADKSQLLEMFRRINAYTAPLNSAEKRHAKYQGKFKWFINELADELSPLLREYEILTGKQILRMGDAEFLTEIALILDKGIIDKSITSLEGIYKSYDVAFKDTKDFRVKITDFFTELKTNFDDLRSSYIMKPYVIQSLFAAMTQKKYGIINGSKELGPSTGKYYKNIKSTVKNLENLAYAHETQDLDGQYKEYVEACLSTTHRVKQRRIRAKYLFDALN